MRLYTGHNIYLITLTDGYHDVSGPQKCNFYLYFKEIVIYSNCPSYSIAHLDTYFEKIPAARKKEHNNTWRGEIQYIASVLSH